MTRECVQEVIDDRCGAVFWPNVERTLLGPPQKPGWPQAGGTLWPQLAFYNFVQSPVVGGPGDRPTWQQFVKSRPAFEAVLDVLNPELVWVCGRALGEGMALVGQDIDSTVLADRLKDRQNLLDWHKADSRNLRAHRRANGNFVWFLETEHASARMYSWKRKAPILLDFVLADFSDQDIIKVVSPDTGVIV